MKKQVLFVLALCLTMTTFAQKMIWTNATGDDNYYTDDNWEFDDEGELVTGWAPDAFTPVLFNGAVYAEDFTYPASETPYECDHFEIGVSGTPYGTVTVSSGATVTGVGGHWSAVGWTTQATLVVEPNGSFTTGSHLWLAFNPGAKSFVDVWGTLEVTQMFGVNFEGKADGNSEAKLTVHNGGTLILNQLKGDDGDPESTNSFRGDVADGSLVVMGGGTVNLVGDLQGTVNDYVNKGKIVSGPGGNIVVAYDADNDLTVVTSTAEPLSTKDVNSLTFDVYPNPAKDVLTISSKVSISAVKLYNVFGQEVLKGTGNRINVSSLSAGYYILKATDNLGKTGIRKILVH